MKIEPKDVQPGDRVTLTGTVERVNDANTITLAFEANFGGVQLRPEELANATIERPVDPDLIAVRELLAANEMPYNATRYRAGDLDETPSVWNALKFYKLGKAAR